MQWLREIEQETSDKELRNIKQFQYNFLEANENELVSQPDERPVK